MTLAAFLARQNLTQAAFGRLLGVSDASVSRWVSGVDTPTLAHAVAIERATGGKVRPRDFILEAPNHG